MTDTFTIGTSKFATDLRLSPQCRKILAHLKQRKTISNMESMMVYHVYRLSDVIHKLRRAGYDIDTEERVDGVGGRYATYKLMGGAPLMYYLINVDNGTVIRSGGTKPELQDKLAELQKRNASFHTYVIAYKVAESCVKREWKEY